MHAYLSAFSKLIACIALSPRKIIPVSELQGILNGAALNDARTLGRVRQEIRNHFSNKLSHIDAPVNLLLETH